MFPKVLKTSNLWFEKRCSEMKQHSMALALASFPHTCLRSNTPSWTHSPHLPLPLASSCASLSLINKELRYCMVHRVKALAAKPRGLSVIPRTHMKGGRRKLTPKVCPLMLACAPQSTCLHPHTSCTHI